MPIFTRPNSADLPEEVEIQEAWSASARAAAAAARRGRGKSGQQSLNLVGGKAKVGTGGDRQKRQENKDARAEQRVRDWGKDWDAKTKAAGGSEAYWKQRSEARNKRDAQRAARLARDPNARAQAALSSKPVGPGWASGTRGVDYGAKLGKVPSTKYKGEKQALARRYNDGVVRMNRFQFQQNHLSRRKTQGIATNSQLKRLTKLQRITGRYEKVLRGMYSKLRTPA